MYVLLGEKTLKTFGSMPLMYSPFHNILPLCMFHWEKNKKDKEYKNPLKRKAHRK